MAVALLVAAGRGERLGASGPKAFVAVGGRSLVLWSLEALRAAPSVSSIVVAMPPGVEELPGVTCVPGGETRSESVRNALAVAPVGEDVVVHDAARPLVTPELVEETLAALAQADAAIAAAPVTDTIKEADGARVLRTLDRTTLWAVQTPQAFRREVLERVLAGSAAELAAATDDASLVERAGGTVRVVPAGPDNLKITTPVDLRLAELLLAER